MRKCEEEKYGKNSHLWYRLELWKIVENEYKRVNMIVIDLT